ncbi:hypothetical protein BGAL_0581g00010 [Botrytis galanthina]|uniref:Uncharacterized protein n=1 Tax=Botrytis galanthina TaxID=278940 RepID=A0A4S8QJ07_9HELO|nr:hypothetical protein BGAL_0581g00010 [Botrytis galanthina]
MWEPSFFGFRSSDTQITIIRAAGYHVQALVAMQAVIVTTRQSFEGLLGNSSSSSSSGSSNANTWAAIAIAILIAIALAMPIPIPIPEESSGEANAHELPGPQRARVVRRENRAANPVYKLKGYFVLKFIVEQGTTIYRHCQTAM